ncbi:MAG: DinB family protein [Acidobacteria bacterium]|nr:DinB family protein [Acidobacteriota bacterium]
MLKTLFVLFVAAAGVGCAQPLSRGERDRAMSELHATRKRLLDAIASLSEAQWKFKPAPEVWSIAQIADHLVVSEAELFGMIQNKILTSPADPAKGGAKRVKDDEVLKVMPDRSQKRTAPDFLAPAGKWPAQSAAVSEFKKRRDANIVYVGNTQDELRSHFGEHRAVGNLDAYQWFLVIASHTERHVRQIEEVKAGAKYPKK